MKRAPRPGAEVRLGLLGLGTVGAGVAELVETRGDELARRLGGRLRVVRAAVRDPKKRRGLSAKLRLTTDARAVVTDPDVDVVVELVGGYEPSRSLLLEAIAAGKDVVTANKALLAVHGAEIARAAERAGVRLGFEASVGGGMPIIRTLRDSLAGDRTRALYGIVNGTTNSILTAMTEEGREFSEALADAQRSGLAEADPSLDVDGIDSAHKLALLVRLAFGADCPVAKIHAEGIRALRQTDIAFARELGYVVKLLAIAKDDGEALEARVHPTMIPRTHLLADVRHAFNAVEVRSEALGPSLYVAQGAGRLPTATAVLADLVEIAAARLAGRPPGRPPFGLPHDQLRRVPIRPIGELQSEYYLRFQVVDRPGVLARIAGILGKSGISIASVIQKDRGKGTSVPIVIRTHEARERDLARAMRAIGKLTSVSEAPLFVRIEDRL